MAAWRLAAGIALTVACSDLDVTGKACNQDHPCPNGLVCIGQDAVGRCAPSPERCDSDADCPRDEFCNPLSQCDPGCRCQFEDCASSGFDAGSLVCNADCSTDTSGCYECAAEQELCAGECRFVLSDPLHCSACDADCDPGQLCVAGSCTPASVDWVAAGADVATQVTTHAVGALTAGPMVAYVDQSTPDWDHLRAVSWSGSDWAASAHIDIVPALIPAVAIDTDGARPVAAYIVDNASGTYRQLAELVDGSWRSFGEPYATACAIAEHVDVAVVNDDEVHVLTIGAGGCGYGVEHAWWDGLAWQFHPDGVMVDGGLTDSAIGFPAIASHQGRPLFAIAERDTLGTSTHRVSYFDSGWANLGERLDVTDDVPGFDEDIDVVASWRGEIYTAWAEELIADPGTERAIFVKRYDEVTASWVRVGAAIVTADELRFASLALVGASPWISYTTGSPSVARVARFDAANDTWVQVGTDLNVDSGIDADRPLLVYAAGKPWVAFREGDGTEQVLRVVTLP